VHHISYTCLVQYDNAHLCLRLYAHASLFFCCIAQFRCHSKSMLCTLQMRRQTQHSCLSTGPKIRCHTSPIIHVDKPALQHPNSSLTQFQTSHPEPPCSVAVAATKYTDNLLALIEHIPPSTSEALKKIVDEFINDKFKRLLTIS